MIKELLFFAFILFIIYTIYKSKILNNSKTKIENETQRMNKYYTEQNQKFKYINRRKRR